MVSSIRCHQYPEKHDTQKMLMSVKARFYGTENHEVKSRMLEIAADVLGTAASDWVRELWENDADKFFIRFLGQQPVVYQPRKE